MALSSVLLFANVTTAAQAQLQKAQLKGVGDTASIINGSLLEQPLCKKIQNLFGGMFAPLAQYTRP